MWACFNTSLYLLPPESVGTVRQTASCFAHFECHLCRMGPDIWGLQNRAKGPKYFSQKGYFLHKQGHNKKYNLKRLPLLDIFPSEGGFLENVAPDRFHLLKADCLLTRCHEFYLHVPGVSAIGLLEDCKDRPCLQEQEKNEIRSFFWCEGIL